MSRHTIVAESLVIFLLLGRVSYGKGEEQKTAVLVEGYLFSRCGGLDCPPWPVPPDGGFCFRIGEDYYTGFSQLWGVPWATKAKRLLNVNGQSMRIVVTEKLITVMTPKFKLHLTRVHHDSMFKLAACAQA